MGDCFIKIVANKEVSEQAFKLNVVSAPTRVLELTSTSFQSLDSDC